ncbi:multiubiquitin domain-containing protein, partial [Candidatus Nomurabacteria bacterium]|nr:multiubiquitin domain-containing protein [Candidatus Nomurabacteria bacterium]
MENLKFSIDDDIIDIEWCTINDHEVPKGRKYRIKIDGDKYIVNQECLSGREILIIAGKTPPDRFQLRQKFKGGKVVTIAYDQKVCLTEPGIEKFKTLPLD